MDDASPTSRLRDPLRFLLLLLVYFLSTKLGLNLPFVHACPTAVWPPTGLALGGFADWKAYGPIWQTWWLGDMGGALLVAPLLLLWHSHPVVQWRFPRSVETSGTLLLVALSSHLLFGGAFNLDQINSFKF